MSMIQVTGLSYEETLRAEARARKAKWFPTKALEPPPPAQPRIENPLPDSAGLTRVALTPDECRMIFSLRSGKAFALPPRKKTPTIQDVIDAVGILYNTRWIATARRTPDVVRPRQMVMHLAKKLTGKPSAEIGRRLGDLDHSTVIHGSNKMDRKRSIDRELNDELTWLEGQLAG